MNIFITGATGLVGRDITDYLAFKGYNLVCGIRNDFAFARMFPADKNIKMIKFDLSNVIDNFELKEILEDIDVVIHAAAKMPRVHEKQDEFFDEYVRINSKATYELIKLSVLAEVKQFIYISGVNVVSPDNEPITEENNYFPFQPYILSKIMGEIYCYHCSIQNDIITTILRISAPYGYGYRTKSVLPTFLERAMKSEDIVLWGKGIREQVFTYVRDISIACELCMKTQKGGIFNITGSQSISMEELAKIVLKSVGNTRSGIQYNNKPDPDESRRRKVSIEKAKTELGFIPQFSIEKGIDDFLRRLSNPTI